MDIVELLNAQGKIDAEQAWIKLEADPALGAVVRQWGKCPLKPHADYFRELCESVLAQQISGKVAAALADRLVQRLDGVITPETLASLSIEDLRAIGISARKGATLLELAVRCCDGRIPLATLGELSDKEIIDLLTGVKGVGPWTVMMFLIFSLNRPRVIPAADYGIRKAIQNLFGLSELPPVSKVAAYYDAWAPHESAASWYLWRSLENAGRV